MPKGINPIRKAKVREGLLKGKTGKEAMLEAGYSKSASHQLKNMSVYNCVTEELKREFQASDITVEYVLDKLQHFAETSKNEADRIRATELLGKYLAMFTDKSEVTGQLIIKPEETSELNRIREGILTSVAN